MGSSINVNEASLEEFRRHITHTHMKAVDAPVTRSATLRMTAFGTPRTCEECCRREKAGRLEPCGPCGQRLEQRQALSRRIERRERLDATRNMVMACVIGGTACAATFAILMVTNL